MRIARSLALVIMALLILSTPAMAQKGQFAVAENAELDKFPIFAAEKPLTVLQIAEMHLHPVPLEKPTVVLNHFRGLHGKEGRFVVETLPKGTLVLVDDNKNLRYKEDCGNRLVEFNNQALVRGIVSSVKLPVPPTPQPPATPPQDLIGKKPAFRSAVADTMKLIVKRVVDLLRPIAHLIGWSALILFILFAIWAIYWLIREEIEAARADRQLNLPGGGIAAGNTSSVPPAAPAQTAQAATGDTLQEGGPARVRLQYHPQNAGNPAMIRTNGGIVVHSVEHSGDEHVIRYRLS